MEAYKRGSHTIWDCKYHLVWVTKYRYPVLGGDVGVRCRESLRETARGHETVIHSGSVNRDHVHMLMSIRPSLSVSRVVQHKGTLAAIAAQDCWCPDQSGAKGMGRWIFTDYGEDLCAPEPRQFWGVEVRPSTIPAKCSALATPTAGANNNELIKMLITSTNTARCAQGREGEGQIGELAQARQCLDCSAQRNPEEHRYDYTIL
jgi:REP element-mobilizing transposase RayT